MPYLPYAAQCPMPHALFGRSPMPHAPCPIPIRAPDVTEKGYRRFQVRIDLSEVRSPAIYMTIVSSSAYRPHL